MIQLSIVFFLRVIAVLLFFCGVLIVYLMRKRRNEVIKNRQMDRYIKRSEALWYHYLLEDGPFIKKLVPKRKSEIAAVEKILLSYLKNISNEMVQLKIHSFAKSFLQVHYQKELSSKSWSRRVNAMYRTADFRLEELVRVCEQREKHMKSSEERFQLLRLKSIFWPDNFLQLIQSSNVVVSESQYKQLFMYLDEEMLVSMLEQIHSLQESAQYALIETFSIRNNMKIVEKLERLVADEKAEIRIRALKTLEKIGILTQLDPYIPFVYSTLWEERLMAAKILGHVPLRYTYDYLEALLQDENWWVRVQAANSIVEGQEGVEKLSEFIQTTNDPYAKDMANEVMKRKLMII